MTPTLAEKTASGLSSHRIAHGIPHQELEGDPAGALLRPQRYHTSGKQAEET
jgi:hypothetical protein